MLIIPRYMMQTRVICACELLMFGYHPFCSVCRYEPLGCYRANGSCSYVGNTYPNIREPSIRSSLRDDLCKHVNIC